MAHDWLFQKTSFPVGLFPFPSAHTFRKCRRLLYTHASDQTFWKRAECFVQCDQHTSGTQECPAWRACCDGLNFWQAKLNLFSLHSVAFLLPWMAHSQKLYHCLCNQRWHGWQLQSDFLLHWVNETYFTCTEPLLSSVPRSALHIGCTSSSLTYWVLHHQ